MKLRPLLATFVALVSFASAATAQKRVALVFDDGPRPADVAPLLELLAREQVAVTFSLVGDRVKENPDAARAVIAAGHEVANHSQTHSHPRDLDDAALDREIADAQQLLTTTLGKAPRWYWPPFLEVDARVRAAAERAGLAVYDPHHLVVSKDYDQSVPASEILRLATTDVRDGSVILFHEWRAETRAQLPAILAELRRQGCTFLTFSALRASLDARAPVPPPENDAVPAGGVPLVEGTYKEFNTSGTANAMNLTAVEVEGPGFKQALRIETTEDLSPPWAVEINAPLARKVKKGATGFLRFYARAIASADETGAGRIRVVVQRAGPNYEKSLENTVQMRAEWQEFRLPFTFAEDYSPGGAQLAFGFGFKRETIEIGGIELLDFGDQVARTALPKTRFSYDGREPDAAWRQEALARIEQVRKSGFTIEVRDTAGQPVGGATVRVEQVNSAFHFGTALQPARLLGDKADDRWYRETVKKFFNAGSPENDLKWPAWEGDWGPGFDRARTVQALRWMRENGLHVRGHVLVWPGWRNLPKSVVALKDGKKNQAKIPPLVLQHITEVTTATRDYVQEWDVLNEPYDNHDLMALFGPEIMVEWFKTAQAGSAPGAGLYLNDYSNHDLLADKPHCLDFFKVAKFLVGKGAPLTGLGVQGHISAQPNPPANVLATLDIYAELKLPIRITEFDVDTEDEQLQADYTRDFLILCYSHPSVVGVQHWGFWAGAHWRPRSALFRADWSEKPAAKAYRELVLKQWRTRLQGQAGAKGKVSGRGFHGDYVVTVEKDGKSTRQTFTLKPEEAKTVVTVVLQ